MKEEEIPLLDSSKMIIKRPDGMLYDDYKKIRAWQGTALRDYLKGRVVWPSGKKTYVKAKHGAL